jgi:uncharacterized protein (DUF488 family)
MLKRAAVVGVFGRVMRNRAFFTIGHSNRSYEDFAELLTSAAVSLVADIRKMPKSRANPQFNGKTLSDALSAIGIAYEHVPALGGLRARARTLPPDVNGFWTNKSFHNYADYALSAEFVAGLQYLRALGHERRCAIMCSEAVWWRCHRRIVADHLIARGEAVFHIMAPSRLERAHLTAGAVVQPGQTVVYPAIAHASSDVGPRTGTAQS